MFFLRNILFVVPHLDLPEFLKDFLEHRRLVHGTDDLDAVFDCVACQMLETQLARAERLEGGVAEPTVQ